VASLGKLRRKKLEQQLASSGNFPLASLASPPPACSLAPGALSILGSPYDVDELHA
jgi:hypothetical protein